MGKKPRVRPKRLAEKLLRIRQALGLSQNEMISRMGLEDEISQPHVSEYERDEREPSLKALLHYALAANVYVDTLIDDEINLPENLPPRRKSMGIRKKRKRKKKKKKED